MSHKLKLTVGSTVPIVIELVDENGSAENIADVTRAVFAILDSIGGTSQLTLDTDIGDLSLVEKADGKLIGNLTQVQADALVPGVYVAECNLFFATPTNWQPTERFHVEVEAATATALP